MKKARSLLTKAIIARNSLNPSLKVCSLFSEPSGRNPYETVDSATGDSVEMRELKFPFLFRSQSKHWENS